MPLSEKSEFESMADSFYSFEAFTRIWFIPAAIVPDAIKNDNIKIRDFALSDSAAKAIKMRFSGEVTIYRGNVETNPFTQDLQLPMWVTELEEFAYVPELNSSFALRAQTEQPSFGFTNRFVSGFDTPAKARLLLNLEIEALSGPLMGIVSKKTCTTKAVEATVPNFPFANGSTIFRHVGNEALAVGESTSPFGYIVHGIMTPQMPLAPPAAISPLFTTEPRKFVKPALSESDLRFVCGL